MKKLYHYDDEGRHEVSKTKGHQFKTKSGKIVSGMEVTSNANAVKSTSNHTDYEINNSYYVLGHGEIEDYAHTSDDL